MPPKILINIDNKNFKNVENILSKKNNKKINIIRPKVGEKQKHIRLAEKNAIENIKLKKESVESHQSALKKLKEFLLLEQLPNRIEVYDNSHTFGKESIGVMIVIDQEGFKTKNYRKFNIRYDQTSSPQSRTDDYYMMKEVLSRRLKNIDQYSDTPIPDIIVIDVCRGQLNVAKNIILKNNLTSISLMSISKGKKRNSGKDIIHTLKDNKVLKPNDPLLFFLQRIRDEAHRFAIASHRHRRKKQTTKSILNEIPGIGPKRKMSIMLHFGSIKNIKYASPNEICKVKGITYSLANKIYDFFHSQ